MSHPVSSSTRPGHVRIVPRRVQRSRRAGSPTSSVTPWPAREVLRELLACAASAVVPTIVVGGTALVGFDADRFDQMLRSGAPGPARVRAEDYDGRGSICRGRATACP